MASPLREVLHHFEAQTAPVSLQQMAREMALEPGVLEGMIAYWVRKGRLREVSSTGQTCHSCGIRSACPFIVHLPRYYELVNADTVDEPPPACACGTGSCA